MEVDVAAYGAMQLFCAHIPRDDAPNSCRPLLKFAIDDIKLQLLLPITANETCAGQRHIIAYARENRHITHRNIISFHWHDDYFVPVGVMNQPVWISLQSSFLYGIQMGNHCADIAERVGIERRRIVCQERIFIIGHFAFFEERCHAVFLHHEHSFGCW